jgi:hypothetical protein
VKAPGQKAGEIDDRNARSIDVLPTIADVLGVDLPWKVDGRSLRGAPRPPGELRLFRWADNPVQPPAGTDFLTFDGPTGFARMLDRARSRPAAAPDDRLAPYRLGEFGALVGRRVDAVAEDRTPARGRIDGDEARPVGVDPGAPLVPWTYVSGGVDGVPVGRTVAVAVDGTVAGLSYTVERAGDTARYWALLAPQMFRPGTNTVQAYLVEGSPAEPRLREIRAG